MNRNNLQSGFTLVELLVSIGIMTLMTGTVLANYRNYNTNALFANASEDIVLSLRQAQVYGVGVKGTGASFDMPYGVYLSLSNKGLVLFADTNGDHVYTSADSPPVQTISWGSNVSVSSLLCGGIPCTGGNASITFKRPNPDAFITDLAPSDSTLPSPYSLFSVVIKDSNTNRTSTVTITKAGQISLK